MQRYLLAATSGLWLGGCVVAFQVGAARAEIPFTQHLQACVSGWKADPGSAAHFRYVPMMFSMVNHAGPLIVVDDRTKVTITVPRGRWVTLDCFDIPLRETV